MIEIRQINVKTGDVVEPNELVVRDTERRLTLGRFSIEDYLDFAAARAAAQECKEKCQSEPWVSPFSVHREILVNEHYGAARTLADLTLSLWNGRAYPFALHRIRGLDASHFPIAMELLSSYHRHGENDREFMAVCDQIRAARR